MLEWFLQMLIMNGVPGLKSACIDFLGRFSMFGFNFHQDVFIDYTPYRHDLAIGSYPKYKAMYNVEVIHYPLVTRYAQIGGCDIPLLYVYDHQMLYALGVLFYEEDPSGCDVVAYFSILLSGCVEGSHGLCTKESFDTLVVGSRLAFSRFAVEYCLRGSHHYLMTKYGNDYHLVVPTYDEDKMAYLAFQFIQMLELPYL